jgi:ribosomal-protein-alanine N-acetyltransferase
MNYKINDTCFDIFPKLETERLLLEEITRNDAQDLYEIRSDSKVMKYFDREMHRKIDDTLEMIEEIKKSFKEKNGITWIMKDKNSKKMIGYLGYWKLIRDKVRAEIGFALKPEYWNKGFMKESLIKIIEFGFNEFGLHSIEANVNPENINSIRLLERIGFKKEAYFKEDYFFQGKFLDSVIYSLLETDLLNK